MSIRQPDRLDAWILGSGIASLTAAVHLIQEAHVPPSRIHILETLSSAGSTTLSFGDADKGYDYRAGMRPPFNDVCMDELLSLVPSPAHPGKTVRDDILEFAASVQPGKGKPPHTRFLARGPQGVVRVDAKKLPLGIRDRIDMFLLSSKTDKALGRSRIHEHFHESFFHSGYWLTLSTTFGFKPSHSAAEFRRYVQRFHDLHELQLPHPIDAGQYNTHESIIVPIVQFLEQQGVDFRFNTTVTDILFASHDSGHTCVTAIQTERAREPELPSPASHRQEQTIQIHNNDIVIVTLGSISSSILCGTDDRPPPSLDRVQSTLTLDPAGSDEATTSTTIDSELDENWLLWLEIATKDRKFGNAYNFCTRLFESRLESFTLTLSSPDFFARLEALTGDPPSAQNLLTLRDSAWLITLRIPRQPVFPGQPSSVSVCWGYALYPEREGNFIRKPMLACSGREILSEVLQQLHFSPLDPILDSAVTIPCVLPRAATTLLPRHPADRPRVIPPGSTNLALIGSFVDIPDEVVVMMDYSVRGAQMAVRQMMGVNRPLKKSKRSSGINLLGLL